MLQFLIGFWCGCASSALVACLIYANKRRQAEEMKGKKAESEDEQNDTASDGEVKRRVLLVDDSKLSRTVMKEFLGKKPWTILEANNGEECLRLAKKYKFDLIFLDQNMPGMDGDETLQHLWIDGSVNANVAVVAVSSNIRKENENEFREKGYVACLGKPIQSNRMEEILSQIFSEKGEEDIPEGFSYQKGLDFFDGNDSVYRETLLLFADLWEERREQLHRFLEEKNMEEYAILIHAIKGDARTLGADAFGELAYSQELSAKAGNVRAVRDGFDRVISVGDKTAMYFRKILL